MSTMDAAEPVFKPQANGNGCMKAFGVLDGPPSVTTAPSTVKESMSQSETEHEDSSHGGNSAKKAHFLLPEEEAPVMNHASKTRTVPILPPFARHTQVLPQVLEGGGVDRPNSVRETYILEPPSPVPVTRHTRINSVEYNQSGEFDNLDCAEDDKHSDESIPPLPRRMVVVRYYLDRPGYGLHNSTARIWFHPPAACKPAHVRDFLLQQGILALQGLLVEIYLDKFESFMMLEACEASFVEWNFSNTTPRKPGVLNIRLTDLVQAEQEEHFVDSSHGSSNINGKKSPVHPHLQPQRSPAVAPAASAQANTTPIGLFSFSMMVGLETIALMSRLLPNSTDPRFVLTWGPYMYFVGGLLQVITGIFQVLRGNIYGATAFLGFGCFWFSNGVIQILENHFSDPGSRADVLLESDDPVGFFLRNMYIFGFCCVLLKQTFVMNRLSSALITLLCVKVGAGAFTGWSREMQWVQLVFGWLTSAFAFYVFTVELTNQMYHREVFKVYKWCDKSSPEEVFGAMGRTGTLHSRAARLRQASYNPRIVREAVKQGSRDM
jgi:hypothetical protein